MPQLVLLHCRASALARLSHEGSYLQASHHTPAILSSALFRQRVSVKARFSKLGEYNDEGVANGESLEEELMEVRMEMAK